MLIANSCCRQLVVTQEHVYGVVRDVRVEGGQVRIIPLCDGALHDPRQSKCVHSHRPIRHT